MKMKSIKMLCAIIASALSLVGAVGCGANPDQIVLIGRQNSSGTHEYFREEVLGKDGKFSPNVSSRNGSKDVVDMCAKTVSAIGYSGMGYATDEVKMLHVSKKTGEPGIEPTLENARAGTYPLARNLYLYTLGEPEGALAHYIQWILSAEGQNIVKAENYVPNVEVGPDAPETAPDGSITVEGSDTMLSVAGKWAETYKTRFPNVTVTVGGGGSGKGIASLIDGKVAMANASRDMKADEREKAKTNSGKEVKEFVVGQDALAIYVHKSNKLESISIEQLKDVFMADGKITLWSQLTGGEEKK